MLGAAQISADAPLGFRRWRVWTSQGATESMKFVVGELPEIVEREIAGRPIPQPVTLPVTINGRIFPREDVDVWTFAARAGTSYTCDVMAARLGSPLEARLAIIAPNGQPLAEATGGSGFDPMLRFVAAQDGEYQLRIHDINFNGLQHFVYRLTITDAPVVDHVFPLGGRRGAEVSLRLYGQALPDQPVVVRLPSDESMPSALLPLEWNGVKIAPVEVALSDLPEHLEIEPNDTRETAATVAWPAVVNGRIDTAGDVDCFCFAAAQGERMAIEVQAARLSSRLDSLIRILGSDGAVLAEADDQPGGVIDARVEFTPPANGTYYLSIQDRFAGRGGDRFAYRLEWQRADAAAADFSLALPTDALTVARGTEAKLKVTAVRRGGFAGPISLMIEGLPAGVTVGEASIAAGKNDATLAFTAAADAPIDVARLTIRGAAMIGDRLEERRARKPADSRGDLDVDHLLLAVAMPTPFKIFGTFETKFAERGSTFMRHYKIERGGYDGPLEVSLADRQVRHLQGVHGPTIVVPPGAIEFEYPIHLAPWMELGRTSRTCVMAVGRIADAAGREHNVCFTSQEQNDQIIVLVAPGQLGVTATPASLRVAPGQTVSIRIRVDRGPQMQSPVRVELIVAEHIRGVSAPPLLLAADQSNGTLAITFAGDGVCGPFNLPLVVRATAQLATGPYTAEDRVDVVP
jgi:hypothetical protein